MRAHAIVGEEGVLVNILGEERLDTVVETLLDVVSCLGGRVVDAVVGGDADLIVVAVGLDLDVSTVESLEERALDIG